MLNLVVIGDSIAKGYGSTDYKTDSFGAILGEKMSAEFTNLGVVGLDSEGLLEKLETEKFVSAIEDGDVICLSIGSNDLLKPFLSIFADTLGVEGEEKELFVKIQDKLSADAKKNPVKTADLLSTAMKKLTNNKQLNEACENFPELFEKIIDKIHEINPDVLIYADNIYNPYYGVAYEYEGISIFNISQLCEPYIQKLNQTFVSSDEYTTVDMYSIFRQPGYTHVKSGSIENMSSINMDPHPNDAGYQMMADYIYTKLDSIVPSLVSSEFIVDEENGGGSIVLKFSEKVRLVKDKQLIISSKDKKDSFVYEIKENTWVENWEGNTADLTLDLEQFTAASDNKSDEIIPGGEYILTAPDGSIKDKGNNHLDKEALLTFKVPGEETAELVLTNKAEVKSGQNNGIYVAFSVGIFVIIILVVICIKKLKGIDRKKKEE